MLKNVPEAIVGERSGTSTESLSWPATTVDLGDALGEPAPVAVINVPKQSI